MFHRNPFPTTSRREMLSRIGAGFGTLGLASLLANNSSATPMPTLLGTEHASVPQFCSKSETCDSAIYAGWTFASRHVRLQARDCELRGATTGVGRSQVFAKHQKRVDAVPLLLQAVWELRQVGKRHLSEGGRMRG